MSLLYGASHSNTFSLIGVAVVQGVLPCHCPVFTNTCTYDHDLPLASDGRNIGTRDSGNCSNFGPPVPCLFAFCSTGNAPLWGTDVQGQPCFGRHRICSPQVLWIQLQRLHFSNGDLLQSVCGEQVVRIHGRLRSSHWNSLEPSLLYRILGHCSCFHPQCCGCFLC